MSANSSQSALHSKAPKPRSEIPVVEHARAPLNGLDEWQDYKVDSYQQLAGKPVEEFRNYTDSARQDRVAAFYNEQHTRMTYDTVMQLRKKYFRLDRMKMGMWEALEFLNSLLDDSDPDNDLPQIQHALQSAEASRKLYPGKEHDWLHLTCLIHDLGKLISVTDPKRGFVGEPQCFVVGDSFPVGCAFEDTNVFPDSFKANGDSMHPVYSTKYGIYEPNCGLDNLTMSFGHDEYLYQVCVRNKCTLPKEALAIIRYHSFYPWHSKGGYMHLANEQDAKMLPWIKRFNQFDLYSKADSLHDVEELRPYYEGLINKYFPKTLKW